MKKNAMKTIEAAKTILEWDMRGHDLFTTSDLRKIFPESNEKSFSEGLRRLVRAGFLQRVATGVYFNPFSRQPRDYLIERIAVAFRHGCYNYTSLESALSEYGAISQILIDRITVMTTGRKAEITTPYGTIEFTHTSRKASDILRGTRDFDRPLRFATAATAYRDLKRVGRNLHMVSESDLNEILIEEGSVRDA